MRQLAAYIKEREGFDSIVLEEGFASYKIFGDECYIKDIWADPDYRVRGVATTLANRISDIARKQGCKYLTGSVAMDANNKTTSVKVLLAYGFEIVGLVQNGLIFRKDL